MHEERDLKAGVSCGVVSAMLKTNCIDQKSLKVIKSHHLCLTAVLHAFRT